MFTSYLIPKIGSLPNVESITLDKRASNCSMIENIPPKGMIFSDFICILAMSDEDLFDFLYATLS